MTSLKNSMDYMVCNHSRMDCNYSRMMKDFEVDSEDDPGDDF